MQRYVLIVDDSATNRLLMETVIKREGHVPLAAATSRAAMDLLGESDCDIAFIDLNMPVVNGYALAAEIAARYPSLPLYAVSGAAVAADDPALKSAGFRACLPKPFTREVLQSALHACGFETHAPAPAAAQAAVPPHLNAVYARELQSRAAACQRYFENRDTRGLRREIHTLRALADMLKTAELQDACARADIFNPDDIAALAEACRTAATRLSRTG